MHQVHRAIPTTTGRLSHRVHLRPKATQAVQSPRAIPMRTDHQLPEGSARRRQPPGHFEKATRVRAVQPRGGQVRSQQTLRRHGNEY